MTDREKIDVPVQSFKDLGAGLTVLYEKLDKSGEVDILGVRRVFREWNNKNVSNFVEEDDPYLALIDDFFSRSGSFEANVVAKGGRFDEKKAKEIVASIETQRELVQKAISCIDIDDDKRVMIADDKKNDHNRLLETMIFLDRVANELMQKESTRSSTSNVKQYISGLRSMICAALLAKAGGFEVDFADVEYDVKYDLDLMLKRNGEIFAVDVTTSRDIGSDESLGFVWTKDDTKSRVPGDIKLVLNINHRSRLVLPSTFNNPGWYAGKDGIILGIPSPRMISNFKRVTKF